MKLRGHICVRGRRPRRQRAAHVFSLSSLLHQSLSLESSALQTKTTESANLSFRVSCQHLKVGSLLRCWRLIALVEDIAHGSVQNLMNRFHKVKEAGLKICLITLRFSLS